MHRKMARGNAEEKYIKKRKIKALFYSIPFYICRIFPIQKNKIVFWTLEGNGGYSCNPSNSFMQPCHDKRHDRDVQKHCLDFAVYVCGKHDIFACGNRTKYAYNEFSRRHNACKYCDKQRIEIELSATV